MKLYKLMVVLLVVSIPVYAAGPGVGEMTKHNVVISPDGCIADSLTVRWKLDSLLGEATVNGTYKYEGTCEPHHSFFVWLRVDAANTWGVVKVDPASPDRPGEWGFNVTGSPPWDEALCGYRETERFVCHPRNDAVRIWKAGKVTDFFSPWEQGGSPQSALPVIPGTMPREFGKQAE